MGRQKATAKLRRDARLETKRALRGGKHHLSEEETFRLIQNTPFGGIEPIGMEKEKYDRSPLEARNVNQGLYLDMLESKVMIFATGEAGTGKTFLATAFAADRLLDKTYDKIIVTRPILSADEDMGFLPGTVMEKFMPYFRPVYDVLKERLGAGFLQYCLRPEIEKIEIAPFSFMRGRTFKNAIIILDEAQNVTINQMKLFLTRVGENSMVIVNGDVKQCDLPPHKTSGLADALDRFATTERVGVVAFEKEDCVRSEVCQLALDVYP